MKIYKIAQDYQIVPQNPSAQPDPNISLQNMQNAQSAIGTIDAIIEAAGAVNAALDNLEDAIGTGDLGLKQAISNKLIEALQNNKAIMLLMQMNLLPNVGILFNQGEYDKIKVKITNDMQRIKENSGDMANTGTTLNP